MFVQRHFYRLAFKNIFPKEIRMKKESRRDDARVKGGKCYLSF
jgi:hypothetical protein